MKIVQVKTAALVPYARNARTHSEAQVKQIAASIVEFGFLNPILLADDNTIIAGHGRVMAALSLGIVKVPCVYHSHLTEAQRRAYTIADNQIALNAGWDMEMLAEEMGELDADGFDLVVTGFDADEISGHLGKFGPGTLDDQGRLDGKALTKCPECGHEFKT